MLSDETNCGGAKIIASVSLCFTHKTRVLLVTRIGCAVRKLPSLTLRHGGRSRRILRDHIVQNARDTIAARNTTVRNWSCSDPVISPVIGDAKILVAGVMALLVDLREVILDEQQRASSAISTPTTNSSKHH